MATTAIGPIGIVSPPTTLIDGVDHGAGTLAKREAALLIVTNALNIGDATFALDKPNAIVVRPR